MDADARITQSWLDNASAWVQAVRDGLIPSRRAGTDAAIVDAVLEAQPKSLLDAGCGEGWLSRALARHGIAVTGIDGSRALLGRAREAGGGQFLHVSYDDFTAHPQDAGAAFDAVVFNFSLFAEDIVPVLRAAGSVLQPGGRLLIQTVHPFNDALDQRYVDGWREETFTSMSGDFKTPMPWYFRTMQSWTDAVLAAGFQIEALREPVNQETGRPLSLIIIARAA